LPVYVPGSILVETWFQVSPLYFIPIWILRSVRHFDFSLFSSASVTMRLFSNAQWCLATLILLVSGTSLTDDAHKDGCSFTISASGFPNPVGQLPDGKLCVGGSEPPVVLRRAVAGGFVDGHGFGCDATGTAFDSAFKVPQIPRLQSDANPTIDEKGLLFSRCYAVQPCLRRRLSSWTPPVISCTTEKPSSLLVRYPGQSTAS
jgi:hypothetical protein